MPRRSSGPKLWFDKKRETWTIIDGRSRSRTGLGAAEIKRAEKALADYIASKHVVKDSNDPYISDALSAYTEEHLRGIASEKSVLYDIAHITKWWGKFRVSEISTANCKLYIAHRKANTCARRELIFLNASVRFWDREHGPLSIRPKLYLPPAPAPRQNYIDRDQAARFLWHARKTPQLARLFIIGWYTGSRRGAITGLKWSMVDLKTGIMHRKPHGKTQSKNKKSPPVRIGFRLIAHLKRWKRMDKVDDGFIVNFKGKRIIRSHRPWARARKAAKLPLWVTPHVLRHSRATHMLKQGISPWTASRALGMSVKVLTDVYGHHSPDWQKDAAEVR